MERMQKWHESEGSVLGSEMEETWNQQKERLCLIRHLDGHHKPFRSYFDDDCFHDKKANHSKGEAGGAPFEQNNQPTSQTSNRHRMKLPLF